MMDADRNVSASFSRASSSTSAETRNPVESSPSKALFDQLYNKYMKNPMRKKPQFIPVFYDWKQSANKFRRISARGHEIDLLKQLQGVDTLSDKQKSQWVRLASYYPGSRYHALDRVTNYEVTPPRISLGSSTDEEASPRFLFRDLPAELPKKKQKSTWSSSPSYRFPEWRPSSPFLKLPERQSFVPETPERQPLVPEAPERQSPVPKTPDRRPSAVEFATPERTLCDVDELSPVFNSLSIERRGKFSTESLKPVALFEIEDNPEDPPPSSPTTKEKSSGFPKSPILSTFQRYRAKKQRVRFVQLGRVDKNYEALFVHVGAIRLRKRTCRKNSPEQNKSTTEQQPLNPPSSPEMFNIALDMENSYSTTSPSSYHPSSPIVLLVPEPLRRKYPELFVQFVTKFKVEIVEGQYDHRVSHVLLDEGATLDEYKISIDQIQAIAFKKHLVEMNWLRSSIIEGRLLNPADFEGYLTQRSAAPPSKIARCSSFKLLEGYAFLCAKPFVSRITYDQLVEILVTNSGILVQQPKDFDKYGEKIRVCIIGELQFYSDEKIKQRLRKKLKKYNCVKVHYQWIFEVFATYCIQPLTEQLYDSTIEEARAAGVPERLLV